MLTHLQNLPCNAHEIAEIEVSKLAFSSDYKDDSVIATYSDNFFNLCSFM